MAATKAPDFAPDLHQRMLCRTICCKSALNLVESLVEAEAGLDGKPKRKSVRESQALVK